jgi:uncharacterized delta-60 repeat protein
MKINYCYALLLTIIINYLGTIRSGAQPGNLDTTFNNIGIVIQDIAGKNDYGFATAIQSDGKILTAGFGFIDTVTYNDFVLIRYKTNGQIDSSFGTNGITRTDFFNGGNDEAMSMCIQTDGKIIVAGKSFAPASAADFSIARYKSDGTLDSSFGIGGKVTTDIAGFNDYGCCVKLQSDGKIVMTGYTFNGANTGLAVVRYNSNGTLDNSFDGDGIAVVYSGDVYLEGQSLAIQNDGRIVVCATTRFLPYEYDVLVARLNANGSLDTTFDHDGILTTDFCYHDNAYSVAIQNDGKIIVAGASYDTVNITMGKNLMLIRYNADGSMDNSFGTGGKVITEVTNQADIAYAVTIQSNGKIVTVGQSSDGVSNFQIILTRYNTNGSLDTTFDHDGLVTTNIASEHEFGEAIALQADGNIVIAGFINNGSNFNMFTARYVGDIPIPIPIKISDNIPHYELLIYPNPCSNILFIESPTELDGSSIYLLNVNGRKIKEIENVHGKTYNIDCQNISDGLYVLCVSQNGILMSKQPLMISKG